MTPDNDDLNFSDEIPLIDDEDVDFSGVWKILVVDDDPDVHVATEHALRGVEMLGRVPQFLHADSALEAANVLLNNPDVAVILLDVVMETQSAGLDLVERIRRGLGLTMPRIILRTGQPGYAPELKAIRDYDINDYKTKSELTRAKLFTAVLAALRSYDQILRMDASRHGLEQIVKASGELLGGTGLQSFAAGVIRQLAAFIGVDPEGLVCAQANVEPDSVDSEYIVLAAAGRFEPLMRRHLAEIDDSRVASDLRRCLDQHAHIFDRDHLVLYFPLRGEKSFAVYVESRTLPPEMDRNLLEVFCANISVCADNIHLITRLQDFAYFDRLVGLPNRTALLQAIDQAYDEGKAEKYRLILVDIDQFAEINNAFGHEYGDRLLKCLAGRLSTHFQRDCFVARVSGDAFALLGREDILDTGRVRRILEEPYKIDGVEQSVAISTGIVRLTESGPNGQAVLKDASIARKLAREKGVNTDALYTPAIGFQAKERTYLLQQLKGAFAHDRLFAVFQPQVDLASGRAVGFESLMRWRGDDGQFVPPDRFIPLAEQSGLIVGMGAWMMRDSLYALRQLQVDGWTGLRMAVNVSAVQFRMPDFVAMVERALKDTGIDPHLLELEITESVAMMGQKHVEDTLYALKALGITIAIDDFGTGFSSLSYLDRLPFDRIKIDRTFVNAMYREGEGRRIADLVIQLGHSMNLTVIAEGVENAEQAQHLLQLGCHEAQGYHYGRPMSDADLRDWLKAHKKGQA